MSPAAGRRGTAIQSLPGEEHFHPHRGMAAGYTGMWHTFLSERAAECQRTNPCNGEEQGVADQRNIQSMPHGM